MKVLKTINAELAWLERQKKLLLAARKKLERVGKARLKAAARKRRS